MPNLGNKLILLGLLTGAASLVFAVTMAAGASLAWVLMFAARFQMDVPKTELGTRYCRWWSDVLKQTYDP